MGLITPYLDYRAPLDQRGRPITISSTTHCTSGSSRSTRRVSTNPGWRDSWTQGPNARSWRVKLHRGVQFHHGYRRVHGAGRGPHPRPVV